MDPEIEAALLRQRQTGAVNPLQGLTAFQGSPAPARSVETRIVHRPGREGVTCRVYAPPLSDGAKEAIVFVHGGGWVAGTLDLYDKPARRLAVQTGRTVWVTDYRLAPRHPYPAALMDIALVHAAASLECAGRVHLLGDSAGANLAIGLAMKLRDEATPLAGKLVAFYPPVDPRAGALDMADVPAAWLLHPARMADCWTSYAGGAHFDDMPYACFGAADLSGLPEMALAIAGCDILRDEGLRFVERCAAAGTPISSKVYEALPHAAIHFLGVSAAALDLYRFAASFLDTPTG